MDYALDITDIEKSYPGFTLKNVSFTLPPGFIMGLIGPNGAGKTTIIKLILNLIRRDGGGISVFGLDNIAREKAVKSRIGFVFEEPVFYGYLTLEGMKSVIAPFYRYWDNALFYRLCRDFELPLKKRVGKLSRGMTTKFALALALSHHADLLLLDEPTTGLDPVFRRQFLDHLRGLIQDEGKAVLFSSHITSDLEKIADYVTYIQAGQVRFSSTREEITDNWAIVKGGLDLLTEESGRLFRGIHRGAFGFKALTSRKDDVLRLLGDREIVVEKAAFDDIVLFLEKEGKNG